MPVPSAITDLSQTAGSNSPSGSESPITTDNYFRAHASYIALLSAALGNSTTAGFLQTGTGAVARTFKSKAADFVHIDDFDPTGDGTTDDLTPLTNFINSAIARPGVPHYLGNATYATSAALPTINVSGVRIYGTGPSSNHDLGSINGTCIKKIGGSGGTMLTVSAVAGSGNQRIDGIVIDGVSFNGNQLAAKGLLLVSIRNSHIRVYAEECTTSGVEMNVVATLGEAPDIQDCVFEIYGRQMFTSGACLRLLGSSTANVSLNRFDIVDVSHKDATGIICQNPDNNYWGVVRVYRITGGTATNSIEWQGGATVDDVSRFEVIDKLTCTVAAIAKGTSSYTVAAHDIVIRLLDTENGSPSPTVETGASVAGPQIAWTPIVTAGSGTFTDATTSGYIQIDPSDTKYVNFRVAVTITTNGTAATDVRLALPFASSADGISAAAAGYEGSASIAVVGIIGTSSSTLRIVKVDGTYPGGTGKSLTLVGRYRRA